MDPVGVIASVVGIATATVQSAMVFAKAVKSIKGAQAEIKAISRDVHAFYAVVFSLNALLKDNELMDAIRHDAAIVDMIENLTDPLSNCQYLLTEIMIKMRKRCNLRGDNKSRQINATSMKWGLCTKSEMRDLQKQLEATKSTVCCVLNGVSILCNVRLLAIGNASGSLTTFGSSSTHRLCVRLSKSFDHQLASTPAEQYTIESLFSERIIVTAMKQSLGNPPTQTYFLTYAKSARLWQRVIVAATFLSPTRARSTLFAVQSSDNNEDTCTTLPNALQNLLSQLLPNLPLCSSVSRLSLTLTEDENGKISTESPQIGVAEDTFGRELTEERGILRDLPDLGCPTFVEAEVAVESRISSTSYKAVAKTCMCIERKAPFASAGREGDNGFQDFLNDLKLCISLRDCPGVAKFSGVVLDDTRSHLSGYLYECPAIVGLGRVFTIANAKPERIPWAVREMWGQQIASAISEIHNRGLVLGTLCMMSFGVRANGSVILTRLQTSQRRVRNERGCLPPELRNDLGDSGTTRRRRINYRTDIFQLGYILWLLAEHRNQANGYLCSKAACTAFPRIKCTAEHTNPVELPPCFEDVPAYFIRLIRRCRSPDPRARPPAQEVAKAFPPARDFPASLMKDLVNYFARRASYFCTTCDECGEECSDCHYHCNACYSGNFDICALCFERGAHCFDAEHRLLKIVMRNGRFVNEA